MEVDRTQVAIETQIDDSQALKKIDKLEQKLDGLEKPRSLDFNMDNVLDSLDKQIQSVLKQINEDFRNGQVTELTRDRWKQYKDLNWARGHIYEDRDTLTKADLNDLLGSIGFKLDGDTISSIGAQVGTDPKRLADAVNSGMNIKEFEQANAAFNASVLRFSSVMAQIQKVEKSDTLKGPLLDKLAQIQKQLDQQAELLMKLGFQPKRDKNGNWAMNDAQDVIKFLAGIQQKAVEPQKEEQKDDKSMGKLVGALFGIRSLFSLVRRIVSQNEGLMTAINNFFTTIRNILAPILNFLAAFINTIAG